MVFHKSGRGAPAEGICTDCALCCNGAMFDWVRASKAELAALPAVMGDRMTTDGTGFRQDCPVLAGKLCSAYANRPTPCRKFECELLKALKAGEVGRDEALARIATALRLLDGVRAKLGPGESLPEARARWRSWFAGSERSAQSPDDGEFMLRMTMLNRVLDRHFRKESKKETLEMAAN